MYLRTGALESRVGFLGLHMAPPCRGRGGAIADYGDTDHSGRIGRKKGLSPLPVCVIFAAAPLASGSARLASMAPRGSTESTSPGVPCGEGRVARRSSVALQVFLARRSVPWRTPKDQMEIIGYMEVLDIASSHCELAEHPAGGGELFCFGVLSGTDPGIV